MKIGIAGAGLVGRVLALWLHTAGYAVTLFDRHPPTAVASCGFTAAGMLAPYAELETGSQHIFELGLRSIALWPGLLAHLDTAVEFRQAGSLLTAHPQDAPAVRRLINLIDHKLKPSPSFVPLTTTDLAELEPGLKLRGESYFLPQEAHIDSQAFMHGVQATLSDTIVWRWLTPVQETAPYQISLAGGQKVQFDWVFDCRGLGARQLPQLRGVRGEIIWLHTPEVTLHRPLRLMHPRYRLYVVPRPAHIFLVGATEIESEDMSPISVRSTLELLSAVYSVHAAFGEARMIKTDTNCRPALPDNNPLLTHEKGLTEINGLFRHGYLLAPALVEQAVKHLEVNL